MFLAEAFTRPAMMHGLGTIGFHQSLHLLHLAHRQARDRGRTSARLSSESDYLMRPNFFVNTPDILHELPAVRRPAGVQDPRRAGGHRVPDAGASTPASSCTSTSRSSPGAEEYLDTEKYQLRPRDWEAADGRGPHPRAVPHPAQRDAPRRTRPCSCCATSRFHRSDDDSILRLQQATGTRTGPGHRPRGRQPRPARHARDHRPLDMPALGLDWHDRFVVHDELTGADLELGRAQLRAARPRPRARAHPDRSGGPR